jgi:hypothetical protein
MSGWKARSAISLVLLAGIAAVVPASANDACPCLTNIRCTAQLTDQRQSLAWMYKGIAENPSIQIKGPDGKPTDEVRLDKLTPAARKKMEADLVSKFKKYDQLEAKLMKGIPTAECGGKVSITARMDPQTCEVSNLVKAEAAVPCEEFKKMIAAHINFLYTNCRLAKGFPNERLTPAGLAKEQETAYKEEVTKLKKMAADCCG